MRGMSAIRSSGKLRNKIRSVTPETLPIPVMDPAKRAQLETSEDHGLWGFFNRDKEAITKPSDLSDHGRAWTLKELRIKSWTDLHALWWKCHLELNRLSTELNRRNEVKPGYGEFELSERQKVVYATMGAIRKTLVERWDAWNDARAILNEDRDPDIEVGEEGRLRWKGRETYTEEDAQEAGMDEAALGDIDRRAESQGRQDSKSV